MKKLGKLFLIDYPFDFWLDFLFAMTEKEIKARYKSAFLGFLWIILNPLIQMMVIGLIFQFFIPMHVENYFLFLFAGLLPWNFFSLSVNKATPSIVYERNLIQKAKFPRESIVLSIILSNLFHFLISSALFVFLLIFIQLIQQSGFDQQILTKIPLKVFLLTFNIVMLTLFTTGLSFWLSALNTKYRDISFMVQAILPLWFYATPVIYNLNLIPSNLHVFFYLNPMTPIIELFHAVLLGSELTHPSLTLISFLFSFIFAITGWFFFKKESYRFDDWI